MHIFTEGAEFSNRTLIENWCTLTFLYRNSDHEMLICMLDLYNKIFRDTKYLVSLVLNFRKCMDKLRIKRLLI